ncbi:hypothetical protein Peur_030393 [Populus x canadensis]
MKQRAFSARVLKNITCVDGRNLLQKRKNARKNSVNEEALYIACDYLLTYIYREKEF